MHLAAGCPDQLRRRLNRTTIEGDYGLGRFEHEEVRKQADPAMA